jgi:porin
MPYSKTTSKTWLRRGLGACLCGYACFALPSAVMAQEVTPAAAMPSSQGGAAPDKTPSIWERDKLFGDLGGVRKNLEDKGVSIYATDTSEVLANPTGGIKRNATFEGNLLVILGVDTSKLFGWPGGKFNVSGYDIYGRGLSANNLDNWSKVSYVEAPVGARLFELWYEQSVANDKMSVRIGNMAADQEFLISQYATLFVNSAFGWPTLPATVLPSGGPAYPLATPGVRIKAQINDQLTVLAALFNGDPADNGTGTSFRLDKGAFAIAEAQYSVNGDDKTAVGLPGTYKLGAWYNSNTFPDLLYGTDGLSLANAASNGMPISHRGDWSAYFVADQMIYKVPGTKDQGLGVFFRMTGAPDDRNVISYYIDAGASYKGLIPGRPDDTAGLGVIFSKASSSASQLDQQIAFNSGSPYPIRTAETMVEATYQIRLAPSWYLQPDFQYLWRPQGGIPNPVNPVQTLPDAAVFGLRTNIVF